MYMKQYSVDPIPAVNLYLMYVTTSQMYRYQDLTHSFWSAIQNRYGANSVGTHSNYIQEN